MDRIQIPQPIRVPLDREVYNSSHTPYYNTYTRPILDKPERMMAERVFPLNTGANIPALGFGEYLLD